MFTVIIERKHKAATIISSNIHHIKILPAYETKKIKINGVRVCGGGGTNEGQKSISQSVDSKPYGIH